MVHLTVLVHPVNTGAHPTVPPGWRWAVHVGGAPWDDMRQVLNAGWCSTQSEAAMEGEAVAVAVAKALRMFGPGCAYETCYSDEDPIPSGCDLISLG